MTIPILTYATVLKDSISPEGHRLISFEIKTHRWILAEINTHAMLSRNFRSSRAVPVKKLIEEVRTNPAMPVKWLKNQPGMQGGEEMSAEERAIAEAQWVKNANIAADQAEELMRLNLHKQWSNRVLEPYMYVYGIVTATDWNNFYRLRNHHEAQPEFELLAQKMWEAKEASTPKELKPGEWHLPYVTDAEIAEHGPKALSLSAARCARISYSPFDGNASIEKEMERAQKLLSSGHMSPFEHQGTPDEIASSGFGDYGWKNASAHGKFRGWIQNRKLIPNECAPE